MRFPRLSLSGDGGESGGLSPRLRWYLPLPGAWIWDELGACPLSLLLGASPHAGSRARPALPQL